MATAPYVPGNRDTVHTETAMPPARSWFGNRPGEVSGDPHAPTFGMVGPDTGYVGRLVPLFRHRLITGRMHGDDAAAAGASLAARRAAVSGRGPMAEDLEVAFLLLGVLDDTPGDWTQVGDKIVGLVNGMRYASGRAEAIAADIPEDWLVAKPQDVCSRLGRDGPGGIWAGVESKDH
jgi:hypothetical protein